MNEQRNLWIVVVIAIVALALVCCTCCMGAGMLAYIVDTVEDTTGILTPPPYVEVTVVPDVEDTPEGPAPEPQLTLEPLPPEADETLAALKETEVPESDLHELGIRFLGVPADTPRVASTTNPDYPVGTERRFNVSNVDTDQQFEIEAVLVYKTPHVYMWVEKGERVDQDAIEEAADLFEEQTYPTNRAFFGSEWTPGVDGDPHLSILHATNLGNTVAGYFSSPDANVRAVRADSNEMEMFYINIDNVAVGDDFYNGVLAHEFQHMIHWNNDRNEDTWLNEGCSELAMALNDRMYKPGYYDVGGSDLSYIYSTDTQLNTWPEGVAGDASANYGAAYLFVEYFLGRFGEDATQDLVAHDENGMDSVDAVLRDQGLAITHKEFFADWIVANLLDDPDVDEGRYDYPAIDIYSPRVDKSYRSNDYPTTRSSTVNQYGVDYIEIKGNDPLRLNFTGSTQVGLVDTEAYSGSYFWWSNRTDESDTRLTRIVELPDANSISLEFWAWYHIEEDWDYGYVVVGSTESGNLPSDLSDPTIQWDILDDRSLGCRDSNPNGNNFGCGLTSQSNGWEQLEADLSAYAGQEIALRFEYITDAAVNQPGLAIDDVKVIADGNVLLDDDMEDEGASETWIAEGFIRHANILPQEWIVQLVKFGRQPEVESLILLDVTEGEWVIPLSREIDRAMLIVSALAPVTTEPASYEYTLVPVVP